MNKDAIVYYQSIYSRIEDFCKPLNDYFGIALFIYYKVYKDGSYITLSNDESISKAYLSTINNDAFYFQNYLENQTNNKMILWCPENSFTQGMQIYRDKDYWHGLSIITKQSEGEIELCCYIANKNYSRINEFYIKHSNILNRFAQQFKATFANTLAKSELYKAKYKSGFDFYLPEYQKNNVMDIQDFLQAIGASSNSLNIDGQIIQLTKREMQCLELLEKGCSAKIIGRELLLSPKTIENHLNNIRQKTGIHHKHDLLKFYRQLF